MSIALRPDFDIAVCGLGDLTDMVRRKRATHVMSLIEPSVRLPDLKIAPSKHFVRRFDDVEDAGHRLAAQLADVADLLDFAKRLRAGDSLVVHCFGGVCRSTAAALAIILQALGLHDEAFRSSGRILREIAPRAIPNMLIARHADHLLRAKGDLEKLANDIGSKRTIDLMAELDAD